MDSDSSKQFLKSKRRVRFTLRTLLVLVTVFCIWLAWQVDRARKQQRAVDRILALGGDASYAHEFDKTSASSRRMALCQSSGFVRSS